MPFERRTLRRIKAKSGHLSSSIIAADTEDDEDDDRTSPFFCLENSTYAGKETRKEMETPSPRGEIIFPTLVNADKSCINKKSFLKFAHTKHIVKCVGKNNIC